MKKLLVLIAAVGAVLLLSLGGLLAYAVNSVATAKRDALAQLMKHAARDLHDPESVRFRDLKLLSHSDHLESVDRFLAFVREDSAWVTKTLRENPMRLFKYEEDGFKLCGQLNAKNRMGAYVGYTDFYVSGSDTAKPFVVIEGLGWDKKFIADMCKIGVVVMQPPDEPAASK